MSVCQIVFCARLSQGLNKREGGFQTVTHNLRSSTCAFQGQTDIRAVMSIPKGGELTCIIWEGSCSPGLKILRAEQKREADGSLYLETAGSSSRIFTPHFGPVF